jgi:hypothetical protein
MSYIESQNTEENERTYVEDIELNWNLKIED